MIYIRNAFRDYFVGLWGALKRFPLRVYEAIGWQGIAVMIAVAALLGYLTAYAK